MTARTLAARTVPLGGIRAIEVQRTLPHRDLPTVGAWCFLDHFGPSTDAMAVLPHPHTGLQTVTWPLVGEVQHRDSLGSDAVLRPGELNLMTAGGGIAHSEFSVVPGAPSHGLQMWIAMPETSRHGPANFEHHPVLPPASGIGWTGTVFMGALGDVVSPATTFSPLVGAQLTVTDPVARIEVRPDWEYALMGIDGQIMVDAVPVAQGDLRYLPPQEAAMSPEIILRAEPGSRVLLIGGEPFEEELVMWWNFVGRMHAEIVQFRSAWNDAEGGFSRRFGYVAGHNGDWIPAPPLPQVTLRPRRRR